MQEKSIDIVVAVVVVIVVAVVVVFVVVVFVGSHEEMIKADKV